MTNQNINKSNAENTNIRDARGLIKAYIDFFKQKGHQEIRSSSLVPENDPSALFITAGMHPLVPYLMGMKHPKGKRLVSVQKCLRTSDIDKVGDGKHHTFFLMLGNWSLGDYFKEDAIKYSFEFLTSKKWLGLDIKRLGISCFAGHNGIKRDEESYRIWLSLGIRKENIIYLGKDDNWWGPVGEKGPCGPDTEVFYYIGQGLPTKFDPKDENWVEIWNIVFMEYNKIDKDKYITLKQKNVDTGMGVERVTAVLQNKNDDYLTELFLPIIKKIVELSNKNYDDHKKEMRIIADHMRASVFILGDERTIIPDKVDQGYVLRRLIRRAIRYGKVLGIENNFCTRLAEVIIDNYKDMFPLLEQKKEFILSELSKEENKFRRTLERGLKVFNQIIAKYNKDKRINKDHEHVTKQIINGKDAFLLYQSFGFPIELLQEMAEEKGMSVDVKGFYDEYKKHQEISRKGSEKRFIGGLADHSKQTIKLHTATHLLGEALRRVLGDRNIKQKGSNITAERLRYDFNFPRKLTKEELKKVEELVNKKIREGLEVKRLEMTFEEAKKMGAQAEFDYKYGERVSVYKIGDFSIEVCAGPHVKNTSELGHFKIIKEESVAAGIRRIKAILEDSEQSKEESENKQNHK